MAEENFESDSSEKRSENLLKSTAITFNLESISKDLQFLLDKKITFVCKLTEHLSKIFIALGSTNSQSEKIEEVIFKNKDNINRLFSHLKNECMITNKMLNALLSQSINKSLDLNEELHQEDK